jgi:hypothetical protein
MATAYPKFTKEELKALLAQVEADELKEAKENSEAVKKEVLKLLSSIADKIAVYQKGELKDSGLFSWSDPIFSDILTVLNFPKKASKPKVLAAVSDPDKEKIIAAIGAGKVTLEGIAGEFGEANKPFSKTRKKLQALESLKIIKVDNKRPKNFSVVS